jgi:5-methylcytosine-specific restriction endonuclease McrA
MIGFPVLVLNQNYEPLNVCQVRRAMVLLFWGKAEVIENGRGYLHSASGIYEIPSVIRISYYIKRPRRQYRITKLGIFTRDHYTCQYCGRTCRELTLDHVVPRRLGGEHSWGNVVSACVPCNCRKAGRTPKEASMPLLCQPLEPRNSSFYLHSQHSGIRAEWHKYMMC